MQAWLNRLLNHSEAVAAAAKAHSIQEAAIAKAVAGTVASTDHVLHVTALTCVPSTAVQPHDSTAIDSQQQLGVVSAVPSDTACAVTPDGAKAGIQTHRMSEAVAADKQSAAAPVAEAAQLFEAESSQAATSAPPPPPARVAAPVATPPPPAAAAAKEHTDYSGVHPVSEVPLTAALPATKAQVSSSADAATAEAGSTRATPKHAVPVADSSPSSGSKSSSVAPADKSSLSALASDIPSADPHASGTHPSNASPITGSPPAAEPADEIPSQSADPPPAAEAPDRPRLQSADPPMPLTAWVPNARAPKKQRKKNPPLNVGYDSRKRKLRRQKRQKESLAAAAAAGAAASTSHTHSATTGSESTILNSGTPAGSGTNRPDSDAEVGSSSRPNRHQQGPSVDAEHDYGHTPRQQEPAVTHMTVMSTGHVDSNVHQAKQQQQACQQPQTRTKVSGAQGLQQICQQLQQQQKLKSAMAGNTRVSAASGSHARAGPQQPQQHQVTAQGCDTRPDAASDGKQQLEGHTIPLNGTKPKTAPVELEDLCCADDCQVR